MLNVDDAGDLYGLYYSSIKGKTIMPIKVEFYQVWSHSLSIDCAKICNSENNPGGRPVFLCIVENCCLHELIYSNVYKYKSNIQFIHVKAHTCNIDIHSIGNDNADKLANIAIGLESCPYNI